MLEMGGQWVAGFAVTEVLGAARCWAKLTVSVAAGHLSGDEAGLIDDVQAGKRDAFAVLVERYWDRLYQRPCQLDS